MKVIEMNRQDRKSIAEQTLQIVEQGCYESPEEVLVTIADDVAAAQNRTRVFTPEELMALLARERVRKASAIPSEVRNETTLCAAQRLVVEQKSTGVLCLNFASAKNPGGGFLGGSQAQEESLARSSALYETLKMASLYYEINRKCGTALYTDHMILSPDVPVFRDDNGQLLDRPYNVSFLTAPAVNAGAVRRNEPTRIDRIVATMRRRIAMVLALAEQEGYHHLVLGAWGCGVFQNEPDEIADLFAEQLTNNGPFSRSFESIVFAILDRQEGMIFNAFQRHLGNADRSVNHDRHETN